MRRALLYLRQSDSDGAGERSLSIESQASVLRTDAARNQWTIVEEIRDADEKGWDDKRPGLLRLYDRCRAGDVDVVAVWSLSRLARSLRIQEQVFDELTRLGVEVWSHEEPDVNRPLFRQILGAFNEEQTRVISAHVRRALHQRHQDGLSHGRILLGYRREEGRLEIDEDAASTIRFIFEQRANGASWGHIAYLLEQEGIPPPRGGTWGKNSLIKMLKNPAYRGERPFGAARTIQACPAIITPELWERAQRRDDLRPRSPRSTKTVSSWLEGLVIHGCGRPMYLGPSRGQGRLRCAANIGLAVNSCTVRPASAMSARVEHEAWAILVADLECVRRVPLREILADARRNYQRAQPGNVTAHAIATGQRDRALDRQRKAEELYLSGRRDRAWFEAEDAKVAVEIANAETILRALPTMPDASALEALWHELRALSLQVPKIERAAARAVLLRRLGVVRVNGHEVTIDYRPDVASIFGLRGT